MNRYLSIIAVARNDDYGGNFLNRCQLFINNQITLWQKYGLNAELIIVEWNPPIDKPRLKDVLLWPKKITNGTVRIIEVPNNVHTNFPKSEKIKLFEYVGKNVGIRRANGKFILTTNCDLLYSLELIKFFADQKLKDNELYRVDRYDFDGITISPELTSEEQIKIASQYLVQTHNPYGAAFLPREKLLSIRNTRRIITYIKNYLLHFPFPVPYTNAAGDFFLMHRKKWYFLKGFPELDHYNFPDALCYMALAHGLQQINLKKPLCIYHKEHNRGNAESGRPLSDGEKNKKLYLKMLKEKNPWLPNNNNWGLANKNLPEDYVL